MARHKPKKFHAIARGHIDGLILSSWAIADALTNDFKGKAHKGFQTLEEAESYLKQNGYSDWVFIGDPYVIQPKSHGRRQVYAVANGNKDGTYSSYRNGAERQVSGYPRSSHKKFYSLGEATAYIQEFKETKKILETGRQLNNLSDSLQTLHLSSE